MFGNFSASCFQISYSTTSFSSVLEFEMIRVRILCIFLLLEIVHTVDDNGIRPSNGHSFQEEWTRSIDNVKTCLRLSIDSLGAKLLNSGELRKDGWLNKERKQ